MIPCIDNTPAHYWVIETSNGPLSSGECQRCGSVFKEFKNYIEVIHITLEEDDAKKLLEIYKGK